MCCRTLPRVGKTAQCPVCCKALLCSACLGRAAKSIDSARRFVNRQIVIGLEIEPKLGGGIESLREKPRSIWRNAPFAPNEFVDALDRYLEMRGQRNLGLAQRKKKIFSKDLTRVSRNSIHRLHDHPR